MCSSPKDREELERLIPLEGESKEPSEPSKASEYLPGGQMYQNMISSATVENPRNETPVPQWLHEWEQKWDRSIGEGNKDGQCFESLRLIP